MVLLYYIYNNAVKNKLTMKNWGPPEGYVEKKYNYTYKLTFKYDERYYYYGVHSTNKEPDIDGYFGSGKEVGRYKEKYGKDCFKKKILNFYNTRKEALLAEDALVPVELLSDEFCLNKIQGGGTFDTTGMHLSEEMKKEVSKRFKGKKRTKESIEKMLETKKKNNSFKTSEETKKKLSEKAKNKIFIYKDDVQKRIDKHLLDEYLKNGWIEGYKKERNEKVSKSKIGSKNPMFGKAWSKESIEKMLETKKKNNTLKHDENTKQKLAEKNRERAKDPNFRKKLSQSLKGKNTWCKGRIFIKKNLQETNVDKEKLSEYISNGWVVGRLTKEERKQKKIKKQGK